MTKVEIVDAAFKVWGRNFYLKTSLSQLAKELKVSKPALYRHFENKNALISAMKESFLDDFSASVKDDFEKAQKSTNIDEGILILIQSVSSFLARNVYLFIFTLINFHDQNQDNNSISERLSSRGADMNTIQTIIKKKYDSNPALIRLIFTTLTFLMSNFHITNDSIKNPPSGEQIQGIISKIYEIIKNGLKFSIEEAGNLNFEKLEKQIDRNIHAIKPEPLFKAVAEAVAQAGPWDTSMDMVAKRVGLSKSSLYGHFKNKKDMLRRLFTSEFMRIIEFARNGIKLSENTAEQLYLGIYSISVYLKLRSEILIAMDWIRTRKLDLGKPEKQTNIFRLFEDVEIASLRNAEDEEKQNVSHWILFLLIGILMQPNWLEKAQKPGFNFENDHNDDIRQLFKFITLGLGGFVR
jgi:AcrR family transcriptional regulator